MTLIPEWRSAFRFFSIWVALFAVVVGLLPLAWLDVVYVYLGLSAYRVPAYLGLAFIAARLTRQNDLHTEIKRGI